MSSRSLPPLPYGYEPVEADAAPALPPLPEGYEPVGPTRIEDPNPLVRIGSSFVTGLRRGVKSGAGTSALGDVAVKRALGRPTGEFEAFEVGKAAELAEQAAALAPEKGFMASLREAIHGRPGPLVEFAGDVAGQALPYSAVALPAATAGGPLGAAGAALAMYPTAVGSIYERQLAEGQDEPGKAALLGVPYAAVEVLPEARAARLLRGGRLVKAIDAASIPLRGAAEEATQTALERGGAGLPVLAEGGVEELVEAGGAGLLGEGLLAGAPVVLRAGAQGQERTGRAEQPAATTPQGRAAEISRRQAAARAELEGGGLPRVERPREEFLTGRPAGTTTGVEASDAGRTAEAAGTAGAAEVRAEGRSPETGNDAALRGEAGGDQAGLGGVPGEVVRREGADLPQEVAPPAQSDPLLASADAATRRTSAAQLPDGPLWRYADPKARPRDEVDLAFDILGRFGYTPVLVEPTGTDVDLWDGLDLSDTGRRGTILLNVTAPNPLHVAATHELMHELQHSAPDLWAQVDAVVREVGDLEGFRSSFRGSRLNAPERADLPAELAADFTAEQFTRAEFWDRLIARDPSAFERVARKFLELLDRMMSMLREEYAASPYVSDVVLLRETVADQLVEFRRRRRAEWEASGKGRRSISGDLVEQARAATTLTELDEVMRDASARDLDAVVRKIVNARRRALQHEHNVDAAELRQRDPAWRLRHEFRRRKVRTVLPGGKVAWKHEGGIVPEADLAEEYEDLPLAYRARKGDSTAVAGDVARQRAAEEIGVESLDPRDFVELLRGRYQRSGDLQTRLEAAEADLGPSRAMEERARVEEIAELRSELQAASRRQESETAQLSRRRGVELPGVTDAGGVVSVQAGEAGGGAERGAGGADLERAPSGRAGGPAPAGAGEAAAGAGGAAAASAAGEGRQGPLARMSRRLRSAAGRQLPGMEEGQLELPGVTPFLDADEAAQLADRGVATPGRDPGLQGGLFESDEAQARFDELEARRRAEEKATGQGSLFSRARGRGEDLRVEQSLARRLADVETADRAYAALPDTQGGRVLDVDAARELSPEYSASVESRARFTRATQRPASEYVRGLYRRQLNRDDLPGEPVVTFLAGGGGSGKTTAAQSLIEPLDPQLVYDTTLANRARAISDVEAALDTGRDVHVVFVYRPFVKAVDLALSRGAETGRTVPLRVLAEDHVKAIETVNELQDRYSGDDRVRFTFIDNSGGREDIRAAGLDEVSDFDYRESGQSHEQAISELLAIAEEVYHDRRSTLPTHLVTALDGRGGGEVAREGRAGSRGRVEEGREEGRTGAFEEGAAPRQLTPLARLRERNATAREGAAAEAAPGVSGRAAREGRLVDDVTARRLGLPDDLVGGINLTAEVRAVGKALTTPGQRVRHRDGWDGVVVDSRDVATPEGDLYATPGRVLVRHTYEGDAYSAPQEAERWYSSRDLDPVWSESPAGPIGRMSRRRKPPEGGERRAVRIIKLPKVEPMDAEDLARKRRTLREEGPGGGTVRPPKRVQQAAAAAKRELFEPDEAAERQAAELQVEAERQERAWRGENVVEDTRADVDQFGVEEFLRRATAEAPKPGSEIFEAESKLGKVGATVGKVLLRDLAQGEFFNPSPEHALRVMGKLVPEAEDTFQRMERAKANHLRYAGSLLYDMLQAWKGLTRSDRKWVRRGFIWAYEDGKAMPNARVQQFSDAWTRAAEWIGSAAEGLGVKLLEDPRDPGYRVLFKKRPSETYVPHRITEAVRMAVLRKHGPIWHKLVEEAGARGIPVDLLLDLVEPNVVTKRHGSIEHHRTADLPRKITLGDGREVKVLEDDPWVLVHHVVSATRRLAIMEQFGQEGYAAYAEALAEELVRRGAPPLVTKRVLISAWKQLQGTEDAGSPFKDSPVGSILWNLLDTGVATMNLSAAVISNTFGGHLPLLVRSGLGATVRGYAHAVSTAIDSANEADLAKLAFLHQDLMTPFLYDIMAGMEQTRAMERLPRAITGRLLRGTGFQLINRKINQATAYVKASIELREELDRIRTGASGGVKKLLGHDASAAHRNLRDEFGFSETDITRMVLEGPRPADISRAAQKHVENVNAINESPMARPEHVNRWLWRIAFAYSTFVRKMGRTTEYAVREARQGNVAPMLRLLVAAPITGEVMIFVRNFLKDREREEENWWERLANDFVEVGTLGVVQGFGYALRHFGEHGHSFFEDAFMPPQAEALQQFVNALAEAGHGGELRPVWKALVRVAPLVDIAEKTLRRGDAAFQIERLSYMVYVGGRGHEPLEPRPGRTNTARRLMRRLREMGYTNDEILDDIREYRNRD